VLNPGAGWPNKQWPPEKFGAVAAAVQKSHGLPWVVVWGPGEESLARRVEESSAGAAMLAPPTGLSDLMALVQRAAIVVAGDTGPIHLAAAAGTPVVGLYGPTSPGRNGPWLKSDICVSRFEACTCHHKRRCTAAAWCLDTITVDEVVEAVGRRLNP
jgi:heptosyltransferase-1